MYKTLPNKVKGFTLIELLVVISIIGILSSVVTISLANAKIKARDSVRMHDLNQLRTALTLYYYDNEEKFPGHNGGGTYARNSMSDIDPASAGFMCDPDNNNPQGWSSATNSANEADFVSSLQNYMQDLSVDPLNGQWRCYMYCANADLKGGVLSTFRESDGKYLIFAFGDPNLNLYPNGGLPGYCMSSVDPDDVGEIIGASVSPGGGGGGGGGGGSPTPSPSSSP